jgi:hypothetical protein
MRVVGNRADSRRNKNRSRKYEVEFGVAGADTFGWAARVHAAEHPSMSASGPIGIGKRSERALERPFRVGAGVWLKIPGRAFFRVHKAEGTNVDKIYLPSEMCL